MLSTQGYVSTPPEKEICPGTLLKVALASFHIDCELAAFPEHGLCPAPLHETVVACFSLFVDKTYNALRMSLIMRVLEAFRRNAGSKTEAEIPHSWRDLPTRSLAK